MTFVWKKNVQIHLPVNFQIINLKSIRSNKLVEVAELIHQYVVLLGGYALIFLAPLPHP